MKKYIGALVLLTSISVAIPAFAQTADDYGTAAAGTYCPSLSTTMQRGARDGVVNGQVSELQKFLADYYDLDPSELVSGYFGRITQSYVIKYQKEQGLPSLGIAGQLTRASIARLCSQLSAATSGTQASATSDASVTPVDCTEREAAFAVSTSGHPCRARSTSSTPSPVADCAPGQAYSSVTGQSCVAAAPKPPLPTTGCVAGQAFNPLTGLNCSSASVVPVMSVAATLAGQITFVPDNQAITVSPSSGGVGSVVRVTGTGVAFHQGDYLYLDNASTNKVFPNSWSQFYMEFAIPSWVTPGTHKLFVGQSGQ